MEPASDARSTPPPLEIEGPPGQPPTVMAWQEMNGTSTIAGEFVGACTAAGEPEVAYRSERVRTTGIPSRGAREMSVDVTWVAASPLTEELFVALDPGFSRDEIPVGGFPFYQGPSPARLELNVTQTGLDPLTVQVVVLLPRHCDGPGAQASAALEQDVEWHARYHGPKQVADSSG